MLAPGFRLCFAIAGATMFCVGVLTAQATREKTVEFNRDIRPILAKCMTCHGPDTGEGYAGLRLDAFATATKTLKDGKRAIVPGNPDESELIRRVFSSDPDVVMPPADSHKILKAEEKELLRTWIAEGAEYRPHWGFVTPTRPAIPKVKDASWVRNPIDNFILARLEMAGLKPEPEADKTTLLRRVTLDLTGLPPTPEEIDAYLADTSKNAYEKVVNRLLASKRYGERMAMDWMDYARYADSNGYQADYERYQSRWRDWVIDAFNANMPYDEFTIEQIAGDLLPNATTDQKLATAFNRNHRINTEGGVIAEEWRVETVVDRVETTSAVWLGLTAGCARCHDHKYDPISQKDFYKLFAYFNNVPESGTGEERPINHPPTLRVPTHEQTSKLTELTKLISELDARMDKRVAANAKKASGWTLTAPLPKVDVGLVQRFTLAPTTVKPEGKVTFDAGRVTGAAHTGDGYLDLGSIGDFERDQPFSYGGWVKPDKGEGTPFSRMDSNSAYRGWEASIFQGRPQTHIISNWPENAVKVASTSPIPNGKWSHLFITYDGSSKAAGLKIFVNGKPVELTVERDALTASIKTGVTTKIGRRTNSEFFFGSVDDFAIYNRALQPEEVARLASVHPAAALLTIPVDKRTPEQKQEVVRLWSLDHDPSFAAWDTARNKAANDKAKLDAAIPSVMVMEEMAKPRDAFVLIRGQYDKQGDKVEPGLPSFLPGTSEELPKNRLGLAKWIASGNNPLTSRVTVNRLWERFFGNGIVSTSEDFGTRAEYPSHPELLDYLATEFVRLKWDLKAIMKEMVLSAAYRQSSNITAEKLEKDPLNRLVSRGARYRLPGEVIRDQALFASGLLVEKIGGPSVRPYMPDGVWDETNFYGNLRNYMHDKGDGLHRRSLYTIWKRTAAPPNMLMFDVPSRETCRVRRARTDTPLQALTLLNDETYLEAARVLAQKIMRQATSVEDRLTIAFKRVVSRPPTKEELDLLAGGVRKRIATYRKDPAAAKEVVFIGDAPIDLGLDRAELAAYTVAASTLLNLDEAVTKE